MERWAEVSYYYHCHVSYILEPPCSVLVLFLCLVKSVSVKLDRQQVRCSVMCDGVNTHLSFLWGVHRAPPAVGLCLSPPPAAAGRSSPRQTGASAAAESGRSENRRRCQSSSLSLSLSSLCVDCSYDPTCLLFTSSAPSFSSSRCSSFLREFTASAERAASCLICSFIWGLDNVHDFIKVWQYTKMYKKKMRGHKPAWFSDSSLLWLTSAPEQLRPRPSGDEDRCHIYSSCSTTSSQLSFCF